MPHELLDLEIEEVSAVDAAANQRTWLVVKRAEDVSKGLWSQAHQDTLPDSSFAYVEPGDKDSEGKTTPRSKRHLPYRTAQGPDAAHVRNALQRLPQTDIPASAKASARRKLMAAAKQLGIEVTAKQAMPLDPGAEADEPPPMTLEERQQSRLLWQQWNPLWWDFCDTVHDILDGDDDDPDYADILMQSIDQFRAQANTLLESLGLIAKAAPLLAVLDEVHKAGAAISAARRQRLQDAIAALQAILDEAMPKTATQKGAAPMAHTVEELTAQVATLTKRAEAAEAQVADLTDKLAKAQQTPEQQEAAYLASLPEAVRKRYEAEQVEKAELRRKLDESEARVQKQDYTAQAQTFRSLPLNPAEDWEVFKAIAELPTTTATIAKAAGADQAAVEARVSVAKRVGERLMQLLKAADEALRVSGVMRELGVNGTGPAGESAEAKAVALAKAKQAANSALSFAEALNQVWKENDGLYQQYHLEKRGSRA
jgi:hypothetical protein